MANLMVKDVLTKTTLFFREKGIDTARLDSELLISSAMNWQRMQIYLNYEYPMTESELSACRELVRRRASGEPVAYILGQKDFYNHSFKVSPAVLIPRPETETIVEEALAWMREMSATRVVDFGTGSGCIGISILAEIADAKLWAVDISSQAIEVAQANAQSIGIAERACFCTADVANLSEHRPSLESWLGGLPDVIVANPPYIAENDPHVSPHVRKFEPSHALFSPDNGYEHIRKWSRQAVELLRPGGFAMFEVGHEQAEEAKAIFAHEPLWTEISVIKDLAGINRFIRAIKST